MKLLIQQWEAVELFCLFVSKYEHREISEFYNYDTLGKTLRTYSITVNAQTASLSAMGKLHTLENLVRGIRSETSVVITESEYQAFGKYLGKPHPIAFKYVNADWSPKLKATLLFGRWWLYYFDAHSNESGIVRAIMTLKPFNKVVVDTLRPGSLIKQKYSGRYEVYGDKAEFLSMELKVTNMNVKNLHMLFYVGAEVPELALGQYHNEESSIYSGTLMMEPSLGRGGASPKFFPFKSASTKNDIPIYAYNFFSEKSLNYLKVTSKITSKELFDAWWEIQKNKRKKGGSNGSENSDDKGLL